MTLRSITNDEKQVLVAMLKERESALNWRLATFLESKHSAMVKAANETQLELYSIQHMLDVVKSHDPIDCET